MKQSIALKTLNECKDLVIQKVEEGNTVVITECTTYLDGIKPILADSIKFTTLPID